MDAADIVIVGGGCMGAATAYYLTLHGAGRVVLIERETQLGTASTGRNAGGVCPRPGDAANTVSRTNTKQRPRVMPSLPARRRHTRR